MLEISNEFEIRLLIESDFLCFPTDQNDIATPSPYRIDMFY